MVNFILIDQLFTYKNNTKILQILESYNNFYNNSYIIKKQNEPNYSLLVNTIFFSIYIYLNVKQKHLVLDIRITYKDQVHL